jgi:hypothetical protein
MRSMLVKFTTLGRFERPQLQFYFILVYIDLEQVVIRSSKHRLLLLRSYFRTMDQHCCLEPVV